MEVFHAITARVNPIMWALLTREEQKKLLHVSADRTDLALMCDSEGQCHVSGSWHAVRLVLSVMEYVAVCVHNGHSRPVIELEEQHSVGVQTDTPPDSELCGFVPDETYDQCDFDNCSTEDIKSIGAVLNDSAESEAANDQSRFSHYDDTLRKLMSTNSSNLFDSKLLETISSNGNITKLTSSASCDSLNSSTEERINDAVKLINEDMNSDSMQSSDDSDIMDLSRPEEAEQEVSLDVPEVNLSKSDSNVKKDDPPITETLSKDAVAIKESPCHRTYRRILRTKKPKPKTEETENDGETGSDDDSDYVPSNAKNSSAVDKVDKTSAAKSSESAAKEKLKNMSTEKKTPKKGKKVNSHKSEPKKRGRKPKVKDPNDVFKCKHCSYTARLHSRLMNHVNRIHGNRNFSCCLCEKTFGTKADLQRHVKGHNESYVCDVCGKVYKSKAFVEQHKLTHQEEFVKPEYPCEICGKKFTAKCSLRLHIESIHKGNRKTYLCRFCGRSFTQKLHMIEHENKHTGRKPFVCQTCGATFFHMSSFKSHEIVHTDKREFQCDVCKKAFRTRQAMVAHRVIHTGAARFECEMCGKMFTQKQAMLRHMRVHTGERPFTCFLCSDKFNDRSILRRHLVGVHKLSLDKISKGRRRNFESDLEALKHSNPGHGLTNALRAAALSLQGADPVDEDGLPQQVPHPEEVAASVMQSHVPAQSQDAQVNQVNQVNQVSQVTQVQSMSSQMNQQLISDPIYSHSMTFDDAVAQMEMSHSAEAMGMSQGVLNTYDHTMSAHALSAHQLADHQLADHQLTDQIVHHQLADHQVADHQLSHLNDHQVDHRLDQLDHQLDDQLGDHQLREHQLADHQLVPHQLGDHVDHTMAGQQLDIDHSVADAMSAGEHVAMVTDPVYSQAVSESLVGQELGDLPEPPPAHRHLNTHHYYSSYMSDGQTLPSLHHPVLPHMPYLTQPPDPSIPASSYSSLLDVHVQHLHSLHPYSTM